MKEARVGCSGWSYAFYRLVRRETVERVGRAHAVPLSLRGQGEPLPDPRPAFARDRGGGGPLLGAAGAAARWFAAPVRRLLEEHGASLAIGHDGRRRLPEARPVGEVAYLRLHHGARGRRGNYSRTELDEWRRRIAAWRSRREVFAYLNNDWEEFAPPNALTLRQGLSAAQPV